MAISRVSSLSVLPRQTFSFVRIGHILRRRKAFAVFGLAGGLVIPSLIGIPSAQTLALNAAVGLLLGFAAMAFLEYKNSALWSEEDVERMLSLPVLGTVPVLRSEGDPKWARGRAVDAAAFVLLVAAIAFALWRFRA